MFTAAIWAMIIIAAASATASTIQIVQQKNANERNAEIAEDNAQKAHDHALRIQKQADQERNQLRLQAIQAQGKQRADAGASGFALGAGTQNDRAADIESAFDLDMRNLNYDIAQREWVQNQKAAEYQTMANQYKAATKNYERDIAIVWTGAVLSVGAGMGAGALAANAAATSSAATTAVNQTSSVATSVAAAQSLGLQASTIGSSVGMTTQAATQKIGNSLAGLK